MADEVKKVLCSKCPSYSKSLQRCKQGKINPKTIKGGVSAVMVMGISYICSLCPIKSKIVEAILVENQSKL